MINLHSKTGLGRSGHVWFQSFGPIWHVSNPKMVFWQNNLMILHHFCWRSSKIKLFYLMCGNGTLLDRCHVAPQRNTCFLVLERCWSRNKLKMIVSYSHMTVVRLQAEGWTHKGEYPRNSARDFIPAAGRFAIVGQGLSSELYI